MDDPLLRLCLTGHPAVRATHAKTLEFSDAAEITERATCVVGVGALAEPADAVLAGPIRITITAGDEQCTVEAIANPGWRPGGPAVVRRGSDRRPDTLATEADHTAAELPRALVARAAQPGTPIVVECRRLDRRPDGRAGLVLLWHPATAPPDARLAAEVAAADAVVVEDPAAARLLSGYDVPTVQASAAATGLLDGALGRVLVVATADLPGAGLAAALARPDRVAVEVAGLPPAAAAAAASPWRGPIQLAGTVARARIDAVLRGAPAAGGVAGSVATADLPRLLEVAQLRRPGRTGVVADPAAGGPAQWGPLAELRAGRTGGAVTFFLDGTDDPAGLDAELAELFRALLADGVSARSLALALAARPGWSRRRAYDAVHALEG